MQYSVKILVTAQCYLNKYNHSHLEQEFSIYLHYIQFAAALLAVGKWILLSVLLSVSSCLATWKCSCQREVVTSSSHNSHNTVVHVACLFQEEKNQAPTCEHSEYVFETHMHFSGLMWWVHIWKLWNCMQVQNIQCDSAFIADVSVET